ncbi:MAG: hypothetical protein ACKOZW_12945 [Cyanobium sp.]
MGLTLIEAAKYETRLEHLAVLKTFSEGELLARLPFLNINGSGLFYAAEKELPSVGFRAVNEGYSQSYGVIALAHVQAVYWDQPYRRRQLSSIRPNASRLASCRASSSS